MSFYKTNITDSKLTGVCGGLAKYFGIDALLVRLLFVGAVLCWGVGVLPYIVLALVASEEPVGGA